MPSIDWSLVGTLLVLMFLAQAVCWLIARGLRLRLERRTVIAGCLAPLLLLAPWLNGRQLLVPSDIIILVPGAPPIQRAHHEYDLLNDIVFQMVPWEVETRLALADLRLPFWSDTLEGGSSPWANPQARVLSPVQMATRALPIHSHFIGSVALNTLIALEGAWLLARVVGCSRAASLLAAGGFSLGGGMSAWALFPIATTVAWVPWLAVGTVRIVRRPDRASVATTACITAVLLVSGHPETAAFGGVFALVCALGLQRRRRFTRGMLAATATAVLGLGLSAPHLLPFLELASRSRRAHEVLAAAQVHPASYVSALMPLTWFVPAYRSHLLAPIGPHVYGRPYRDEFGGPFTWPDSEAGYTGLVAFAGTVVALLAVRERRVRPFLGFAVLGLLVVARILPFARLVDAIPVLRLPTYARLLPIVSLALCLAGAFGIDAFISRHRWALARAGLGLATLTSLAVTADAWTVGCWLGLIGAFAATRFSARWGTMALAAVLLVDLVPWSRAMLPKGDPSLFFPRTAVMDLIAREADAPSIGRALGGDLLLYPNVLPVYGVADLRTNNPLAPDHYVQVLNAAFGFSPTMTEYFSPFRNLDHPLLDYLGVRVVLGSPAVPTSRTLQRIDEDRFLPYTLLRNPDPLPRWFLPASVESVTEGELMTWIAQMQTADAVAVRHTEVEGWNPGSTEQVRPARVLASSPGHVVLGVPDEGERLLASSTAWSAGWSAHAGAERLRTLTINGAFLGVQVPAGVSRVELRFLPPQFLVGCAASVLSLSVVLFCLSRRRRQAQGLVL